MLELRHASNEAPIEMSVEDFCQQVRTGTVEATACYRAFWTNGEWRPVHSLPAYRKNKPVELYSKEDLEAQARREELVRKRQELFATYRTGALIERYYNIGELHETCVQNDAIGIARFMVLPSFQPESVFTFSFRTDSIEIDAVRAVESVWNSVWNLSQRIEAQIRGAEDVESVEVGAFHSDQLLRRVGALAYNEAPPMMASWTAFIDAARKLSSCSTLTLDGICYVQKVLVEGTVRNAMWANPRQRECPGQKTMVDAYRECIEQARLGPFLQG